MGGNLKSGRKYPWTEEIGGHKITFRLMTPEDRDAVIAFTETLTKNDLVFLEMDITKPEVIDEWIAMVKRKRAFVLLAIDKKGQVLGYASLYHNELPWTRHQGEIRVFICDKARCIGLGKRLASEIVQIAEEQHLDIIVVNIPRGQPHIRQMLEKVGFTVDTLLPDWLMDHEGRTHDLIIMSHRLREY
jgi:L-amino acid N-acyltransferase YncA